jgi:hypothetical protein
LVALRRATETTQKCLLLDVKATLQITDLLTHDTILLGLMTDLLGEVINFLGITNKTAPLLCNDVLSVMLQLKQMLGISSHVRPITVVVSLKDVAHLIHTSFPLWVRAVLDRIQ